MKILDHDIELEDVLIAVVIVVTVIGLAFGGGNLSCGITIDSRSTTSTTAP